MQTCTSNRFPMYSIEASVQRKITVKRYIIKDKIAFKNLPSAANYHLSSISTFIPRLFGYNKRDSSSSFFSSLLFAIRQFLITQPRHLKLIIQWTTLLHSLFFLSTQSQPGKQTRENFSHLSFFTHRDALSPLSNIYFFLAIEKKKKNALVYSSPRSSCAESTSRRVYIRVCLYVVPTRVCGFGGIIHNERLGNKPLERKRICSARRTCVRACWGSIRVCMSVSSRGA